jgi:hypothetical protein
MGFMLGALAYKVLLNAEATTTVSGTAVDLAGLVEVAKAQFEAVLLKNVSTYTGSPTVIVTIEEDSTSAFSAATVVATFTTIATTGVATEQKSVPITKRYARAVATFSAATTTGSLACVLLGTNRTI